MREREQTDEELAAIEAALGSLRPAISGASRDRLMFLAGRASASALDRRRHTAAWVWPCALTASLLATTTFGMMWAAVSNPAVVERVVYVPTGVGPSAAQDWLGAKKTAYLLTDLNRTPLPVREREGQLEIAVPDSEADGMASVIVLKPMRQPLPERGSSQPNT
jgi:hypothetical protein